MLRERAGPRPQPRPAAGLCRQGTSTSPGQPGKKHISRSHPHPPRTLAGLAGARDCAFILTSPINPHPQVCLSQTMPQSLTISTGHCQPPNGRRAGRKIPTRPLSLSRREKPTPRLPWGLPMRERHSRWQPPPLPGGSFPQIVGSGRFSSGPRGAPPSLLRLLVSDPPRAGKRKRRPGAGTRRR